MRISDWSSDVCSSDLRGCRYRNGGIATGSALGWWRLRAACGLPWPIQGARTGDSMAARTAYMMSMRGTGRVNQLRSEERRGGPEGVSTGGSRWVPDHVKKKKQNNKNDNTKKIKTIRK